MSIAETGLLLGNGRVPSPHADNHGRRHPQRRPEMVQRLLGEVRITGVARERVASAATLTDSSVHKLHGGGLKRTERTLWWSVWKWEVPPALTRANAAAAAAAIHQPWSGVCGWRLDPLPRVPGLTSGAPLGCAFMTAWVQGA